MRFSVRNINSQCRIFFLVNNWIVVTNLLQKNILSILNVVTKHALKSESTTYFHLPFKIVTCSKNKKIPFITEYN